MKAVKFITFLALPLVTLSACQAIENFSGTLSSEAPNIVVENSELTSLFLGHDVFTGNGHDRDQNPYIDFDLRYNPRFLDFLHPIFPANEVMDEDIINWITIYLYSEIFLPWHDTIGVDYGLEATSEQEQALHKSEADFDPLGGYPWGIIHLDNGNQIAISLEGATRVPGDTFVISYRRQDSDAPIQSTLDWFDIASGFLILGDEEIEWYGFIEGDEGCHNLSRLRQSPFE